MTPEHLPTEQYEAQLAEKVVRLQSMMAPFSDLVPEVFRSPVSHYRMRAEFRIWHDGDDLYHIIFDQQTKSRIRVDSFPAASELINQLMTAMIAGVRNNPVLRHKLFPCCTIKSWMMSGVRKRNPCAMHCEHRI